MRDMFVCGIRIKEPEQHGYYMELAPIKFIMEQKGELWFKEPVTFFVGENGIGKSTLLEGIAVAMGFNPEGGTRNFCFSTEDSHSALCDNITIMRHKRPRDGFFLRAESMYNVASYIDGVDRDEDNSGPSLVQSYGGKSLHHQSHGESFLSVVENRFGGNGIYILDEPEAALSPARLLRLMKDMKRLVDNGSQFIISTHSPILMAFPGAEIMELYEGGIRITDYRYTDHYIITKNFLENPDAAIRELLEEDR